MGCQTTRVPYRPDTCVLCTIIIQKLRKEFGVGLDHSNLQRSVSHEDAGSSVVCYVGVVFLLAIVTSSGSAFGDYFLVMVVIGSGCFKVRGPPKIYGFI